ncbi:MAG TPA: ABC transporter permease [Planctomycetota bacterium]|nr:ABC transporter permease [Planctomycetota bacterium]
MKKILVVARHEFTTTVKRVGFLVVTFGLPLFGIAVFGLVLFLQNQTIVQEQKGIEQSRVGFVDHSGITGRVLPEGVDWKRYPDEETGRRSMAADGVEVLLVLRQDYLATGRIEALTTRRPSVLTFGSTYVPPAFTDWLVKCVLEGTSPERIVRARHPVADRAVKFLVPAGTGLAATESPEEYTKRLVTAVFFFALLFISTSVSGGYLIQGMADEKENRVLEMVISSVTPGQLMAGKLIGLGGAGLLQVAIWSILGVTSVVWMVTAFALNPGLFVFCAVFYLFGYLLFGSLLLGIGSLGSNQREAMQYTWLLSLMNAIPAMLWFVVLSEPQGAIARGLTVFPLTAPVTMMARYSVDPAGTPLWEVLATIGWLALWTYLALRFSAKIYKVGLLLYGKRPTPREIWKWLWA